MITSTAFQSLKDFKDFQSEIFAHQTVDIHVECSVNDQTKVTNEDDDKSPRWKGVGHVVLCANVGVDQSDYFVHVHGHSWKVTKYETGDDYKENDRQFVVCFSPFLIGAFNYFRRTQWFLLSEKTMIFWIRGQKVS